MARPELFRLQAGGPGLVSDVVIGSATDDCELAGCQLERRLRIVKPQPGAPLDDGVHSQLDSARQSQSPRGPGHRPGEDAAGSVRPREVILQEVHVMSLR
jgi:hypothetical protein